MEVAVKVRKISIFILLFVLSSTFVVRAAEIMFHNNTGEILTVLYNGDCFTIGSEEPNNYHRVKSLKRFVPFMKEFPERTFKFKIGSVENEYREHTMDSFKDPFSNKDTESAISGNYMRHIYIEGNGRITEDYEEFTGVLSVVKNLFVGTGRGFKKTNSFAGNIIRFKISESDALKGTTESLSKNTSEERRESISIRELKGDSLASFDEKFSLGQRELHARYFQERFLNPSAKDKVFSDDETPLSIGVASSGGGVRARIAGAGFVKGLIEQNLFGCVSYFSAISGSSWMLAPLIFKKEKQILDENGGQMDDPINKSLISGCLVTKDFVDRYVDNVNTSLKILIGEFKNAVVKDSLKHCPVFSLTSSHLAKVNLPNSGRKYNYHNAWGQPCGWVNYFGCSLQKNFLEDVLDKDEHDFENLHLSDVREKVESGSMVIPIFEVRAEKSLPGHNMTQEPCFFTPWEFGSRYFGNNGACINVKTFGSKFDSTKETRDCPDSEKIYEAVPHEIYNSIMEETARRSRKPLICPEPDLGLIMAVCGSAFTISANRMLQKPEKQNIDPAYKFKEDSFDNSPVNCEFNNFMYKNRFFKGFDEAPLLYLHDAGIMANIPFNSLYRRPEDIVHGIEKESAPDIILVFDSSKISDGNIGDELLSSRTEMLKKDLPFPEIKTIKNKNNDTKVEIEQLAPEIIDEIKSKGFYIFDKNPNMVKYKDWQIPTIIYMTLVPGEYKYSVSSENQDGKKFVFDFKKFGTFRFNYDKESCEGLMAMTEDTVKKNVFAIKCAMQKRRIINLERDASSIKSIFEDKSKQEKIKNDIKKLEISKNNLQRKCETLQQGIDRLEIDRNRSIGMPGMQQNEQILANRLDKETRELNKNKLRMRQVESFIRIKQAAIFMASNYSEVLKSEKLVHEEKLKTVKSEFEILELMLDFYKIFTRIINSANDLIADIDIKLGLRVVESIIKTPETFLKDIKLVSESKILLWLKGAIKFFESQIAKRDKHLGKRPEYLKLCLEKIKNLFDDVLFKLKNFEFAAELLTAAITFEAVRAAEKGESSFIAKIERISRLVLGEKEKFEAKLAKIERVLNFRPEELWPQQEVN